MNEIDFTVKFWGVRGSLATPGNFTSQVGGNTACVEIRIGNSTVILDAGTGIRALGDEFVQRGDRTAHIFISHTHWDHIQGFPFFAPAYIKDNKFIIYGERKGRYPLEDILKGQMKYPYFPVTMDEMSADLKFIEIKDGDIIKIEEGIVIKAISINHPGGCLSYRIEYMGKSFCYLTDTEHSSSGNLKIKEHLKDADLVVYDSNFTDEEYYNKGQVSSKIGWGHSTWQEGVKLAKEVGAKKLVLFHHDIRRIDQQIYEIEEAAQGEYENTLAAKEGLVIKL